MAKKIKARNLYDLHIWIKKIDVIKPTDISAENKVEIEEMNILYMFLDS